MAAITWKFKRNRRAELVARTSVCGCLLNAAQFDTWNEVPIAKSGEKPLRAMLLRPLVVPTNDAARLFQYSVHPIIRKLAAFDACQVGGHIRPLILQAFQQLAGNLLPDHDDTGAIRYNQIAGIDHDPAATDGEIDLARGATPIGPLHRGPGEINFPICRSEEHTSELQSLTNLVCRLLLE